MIIANPNSKNIQVPIALTYRAVERAKALIKTFDIEPLHTLHAYLNVDSYFDDHRAVMIWTHHHLEKEGTHPLLLNAIFRNCVPEEWRNRKDLRQRLARRNINEKNYLVRPAFGYTENELLICRSILQNIEYPDWLQFHTYLNVQYFYNNQDALLIWVHNKLKDDNPHSIEVAVEQLTTALWLLIPEVTVR